MSDRESDSKSESDEELRNRKSHNDHTVSAILFGSCGAIMCNAGQFFLMLVYEPS